MDVPSDFQKATRQISKLSRMLANDLSFRKEFNDAVTSEPEERVAKVRDTLKQNGITYPYNITFTAGTTNPRVQIWARVYDRANKVYTNVGYTYRVLS